MHAYFGKTVGCFAGGDSGPPCCINTRHLWVPTNQCLHELLFRYLPHGIFFFNILLFKKSIVAYFGKITPNFFPTAKDSSVKQFFRKLQFCDITNVSPWLSDRKYRIGYIKCPITRVKIIYESALLRLVYMLLFTVQIFIFHVYDLLFDLQFLNI